jgi:energy-coupling factor transport system permease protein
MKEAPRLDPRSKLIGTLCAIVIVMTLRSCLTLALCVTGLAGAVFLLSLGRQWLLFLKGLLLALGTFLGIAWVAFDLQTALTASLRLFALSTVFFIFFQTTSPHSLSNGLVKMGIPYAFAFVLSASMEMVPMLVRRASRIRDAQRARGIPLDGGIRMIRYLPALLGPLLIQGFKLADEVAEAMEARGFGAPGRRSRVELRFRWIDWLVAGGSVIALFAFLVFMGAG